MNIIGAGPLESGKPEAGKGKGWLAGMAEHPAGRWPENLIYPNVSLGEDAVLEAPVIVGKPPRGAKPGERPTEIGAGCLLRPFTTVYAGTRLGARVQTGQGASIREDNFIGDEVSIGTGAVLEFGNRIGRGARIHSGCFLEMATLEEWVFLGPNVVLTDDPHPMGCPKYRDCRGGVTIKKGARVGAGAVVLPGVTIGVEALVGAGAVVTKDVADGVVAAGNPARAMGSVKDLRCEPGFFNRPYEWFPYGNSELELEG